MPVKVAAIYINLTDKNNGICVVGKLSAFAHKIHHSQHWSCIFSFGNISLLYSNPKAV